SVLGVGARDDFRVLFPTEVARLRDWDPTFLERWIQDPGAPRKTPKLAPLGEQNPHVFDARELMGAIVIASSHGRTDGAILWIPRPRGEYWRVSAWDGCLRFRSIEEAFDNVLTEVTSGLEGALA